MRYKSDRSDTKRARFRSRYKIDADSGVEVHRITPSSCKQEADPQHFLYRSKSDPLQRKRGLRLRSHDAGTF